MVGDTDQASQLRLRMNRGAKKRVQNDEPEALTLIRRALDALEVELILALSPQAKGQVERLFGMLQDRMVNELRVARSFGPGRAFNHGSH